MPLKIFDLSILIPTLGKKLDSLGVLLQSLQRQNFERNRYEVLVVLNGDESSDKIQNLFKEFSFPIQLLSIPQKGVNAARRKGLQEAQGKIVLMLDDDVELPSADYFLRILKAHEEFPEVTALGGRYLSRRNSLLLDRIYNLDAHLSLRASQRGAYQVDLLGGCVSYKKEKLMSYGILPNDRLEYGASESEFHHRLFRAGALLKYVPSVSLYHQPQIRWKEHFAKAYRQGQGFKNFCQIRNGPKKSISLSFWFNFFLFLREMAYNWGRGELPLLNFTKPVVEKYFQLYGWMSLFASNLKWRLLRWYGERIDQKLVARMKHYEPWGTVLISAPSHLPQSATLFKSWPHSELYSINDGITKLGIKGQSKDWIAMDIAKKPSFVAIQNCLRDWPELEVCLHCSSSSLTPYEVKRNVEQWTESLKAAKYKNKIRSLTLISADDITKWPEPELIYKSKCSSLDVKISVIIPFFNNSLLLKRVLLNLIQQRYPVEKYEIILVSDGGAEEQVQNILDFLKSYGEISTSLIHWPKANGHPKEFRAGMARQIGALYADGDYLSFLDSDILVQQDYLSELESALSIYDFVQAKRRMLGQKITETLVQKKEEFFSSNVEHEVYEEEEYWENFKRETYWESLWAYWKYTCTYSLSLKRSDFFDLGGFRSQYNRYGFEDVDLGYRAYMKRLRFGFLSSDVFHLYPQGAGTVHHFDFQQREKLLVQSCETFYRLNLSPSLFEEFEFFLQGRNFKYQKLQVRDFAQYVWWKNYYLSIQHLVRLYSTECYWKTQAWLSYTYFQYVHPVLAKPYFMFKYQWNKRIHVPTSMEKELKNGFAKD